MSAEGLVASHEYRLRRNARIDGLGHGEHVFVLASLERLFPLGFGHGGVFLPKLVIGKYPPTFEEDIKATLEAAGYTMDDLITVTVYCSDVKHYADFNDVYRTYFTKEFPARAFVGSGTLLFDARFELQAIAVKR